MKIFISILIFTVSILSSACSDNSYVPEKEKPESGKLSEDNVFKGYESALDKAKGVEQTIQDAADLRRKEMEEQGY